MFKKSLIAIGLGIAVQTTNAKLIELDNMNPDHCRQQILTALKSKAPNAMAFPIVFTYINHCPWAEKLRPIMEAVSDEMPNKTFFAFKFGDEEHPFHNDFVGNACLGYIPLASPTVSQYLLVNDGNSNPLILNEMQRGLNGMSTKQDVENFVNRYSEANSIQGYTLKK